MANFYPDDSDVKTIPQGEKIRDSVDFDLQGFLDDVVDDVEAEHELTGHERVVTRARVLQQLDGGEVLIRINPSSCGQFKVQSIKII